MSQHNREDFLFLVNFIEVDRQIESRIDIKTDRQIDKQTDRQIGRQTDRKIDLSDLVFLPFEKLRVEDKTMLDVRERYWIPKKEPRNMVLTNASCKPF